MLWSRDAKLHGIQAIVVRKFNNNPTNSILIKDIIDLDYDDYMVLTNNIRCSNTTETIEHFSLCMLVAWVSAYKLGRSDNYYQFMKEYITQMPQHHTSMVLDFIQTACYDYQIETFGPPIKTLKDIKRIAKLHAGLD